MQSRNNWLCSSLPSLLLNLIVTIWDTIFLFGSTCLNLSSTSGDLSSAHGDGTMKLTKAPVCLINGPQPKQRIGALLLVSNCRSSWLGVIQQRQEY